MHSNRETTVNATESGMRQICWRRGGKHSVTDRCTVYHHHFSFQYAQWTGGDLSGPRAGSWWHRHSQHRWSCACRCQTLWGLYCSAFYYSVSMNCSVAKLYGHVVWNMGQKKGMHVNIDGLVWICDRKQWPNYTVFYWFISNPAMQCFIGSSPTMQCFSGYQ